MAEAIIAKRHLRSGQFRLYGPDYETSDPIPTYNMFHYYEKSGKMREFRKKLEEAGHEPKSFWDLLKRLINDSATNLKQGLEIKEFFNMIDSLMAYCVVLASMRRAGYATGRPDWDPSMGGIPLAYPINEGIATAKRWENFAKGNIWTMGYRGPRSLWDALRRLIRAKGHLLQQHNDGRALEMFHLLKCMQVSFENRRDKGKEIRHL